MFGGEDIGEIDVFYQWKGAYTKEQMSAEIDKVEAYLDANRKRFGIEQVFSRYREQGWAGTNIKFDVEGPRGTGEDHRDAARGDAEVGARHDRHRRPGRPGRRPAGQGNPGDAGRRLDRRRSTTSRGTSCRCSRSARNCATSAWTAATRTASWRCAWIASARRRSASAPTTWRTFVGLALRGAPLREFRRGDTEVPVWVRFAGADEYGTEDLASFTVRAPDGRSVPLLAMVDVERAARGIADRTHQPPDDADDHRRHRRQEDAARGAQGDRGHPEGAPRSRPVTASASSARSS